MEKKEITLLSHDFSNLKDKTVFDFTDNKELLRKMFSLPSDDRFDELIERTQEHCKKLEHNERFSHFEGFARIIKNKELENEACEQFGVGYEVVLPL